MHDSATPTSESALKNIILDANHYDRGLRIVSGGTRNQIGNIGGVATALNISGLTGITRYAPDSLTLEAKAGTPIKEIEAALDEKNQILAFEPMDHRCLLGTEGEPSIGGVVACNISGPRRFLSGACRDFLLGVRFVDGQGRIINNGGRVMKNVTGLDLTKLTCGAYGTLGVISTVALKVMPRPERAVTLCYNEVTAAQAVQLFCHALTSPFEVSGAAWLNATAMVRLEGLRDQVGDRLDRLQQLLRISPGAVLDKATILEEDAHYGLWQKIRDVHEFSHSDATVWKLAIKATDAPSLVSDAQSQLGARALLDHGGALVWLAVPSDSPDQAATIRNLIPSGMGHATLVRGHANLRRQVSVFHPQNPRLTKISAQLRRQFDPKGLLNPGLMDPFPMAA